MVDSKRKYRELAELSDEITRCGRCGFCQSVCPVYHISADESGVARGRNMYAKELISGTLEHIRENDAFFSECLLCRACVDMCFSAVKTDEIVLAGRRSRQRILGASPAHKYIFEHLLPDHRKLGRAVRIVEAARRMAPVRLEPAFKMFGWFGASIARAEEFSREIPNEFFRARLARRASTGKATKRVMLFIGCGTNFMFPHVGEATVAVLETLGYGVVVVDHGCCGLPAFVQGELATAEQLALNNIRAFSHEPDSIIVTDCSSCASFLKDYSKLLSIEDRIEQAAISEAERFSSRVRDMTELLTGKEFVRMLEQKDADHMEHRPVACFHDPCHLSRYQKLGPQARDVLRSLPSIDFVEMKEADWCCGGAGAFAIEHPVLSIEILERKILNVKSSGADILATTCPSCLMQIHSGIKNAELDIRTAHLVEIARECLEDRQGL